MEACRRKCLKVLSLSYNNLPVHLKPCFLYLAMFRELSSISNHWLLYAQPNIPWLIKVWVSEGFVKPIGGKSLEEAAHEYITDLIDRNLIIVLKRGVRGKLEDCVIHDLLRDLCLREAHKMNLCGVIEVPNIPSEIKKPERSIRYDLDLLGPVSLSRIIRGLDYQPWYATNLRLLRMLDVTDAKFRKLDTTVTILPNEILQLVNLRFMYFVSGHSDQNSISRFTSSISLFWNLQTLQLLNISSEPVFLPPEIWCLPHLRHLEFILCECVLPDPPDSHILENLQTLSTVIFFRCSEEVCRGLPNLKELEVSYDPLSSGVEWPFFRLHNLVHLRKLQSLTFWVNSPISSKYLCFPLSLKELTLRSCGLPWEDMAIVGSLPYLEALELLCYAFKGLTWCPVEGHFVKLKVLKIWEVDLLHWRADKTHFPVLERLRLEDLNLEEFPEDFGGHPTLTNIELFDCNDSTEDWAEQIREEQESFGNENFEVVIRHKRKEELPIQW